MGTEIVINGQRVELVVSDPRRRIHRLIDNYQPNHEPEIKILFSQLEFDNPLTGDIGKDWWFIDLSVSYWDAQIEFFLRKIWSKISDEPISKKEITLLHEQIMEVSLLIDETKEVLSRWGEKGPDYFDRSRRRLHLDLMRSVLNDPPKPDEVRFMIESSASDFPGTTKIDGKNDSGRDIVNITPLPELQEDDLMGQQFRAMGLVHAWQTGRVVISDWNFPVIETEERQIGVPVDKILAEFGGCPFGHVNDHKYAFDLGGYDHRRRKCRCSFSNFCPGGQLLSAGRLAALAKKIWKIKTGRATLQDLMPGWKKMLEKK